MKCSSCNANVTIEQKFCTNCGNEITIVNIENNNIQKKISLLKKIGISVVLIVGLYFYFHTLTRNYHPIIAEQPGIGTAAVSITSKIMSNKITATVENENILVPLNVVLQYRIVRFYDPSGEQKIPILAYVTPRGKIVTAMSISESCRSEDFFLDGENIHCANCQSYWNMESLEAYACCQKYYPDPIPSKIVNNNIVISKSVINNWRIRT